MNRNTILMFDGLLVWIGRNALGVLAFGSILIPISISVPVVVTSTSTIAVPVSVVSGRDLSKIPKAGWCCFAILRSTGWWPSHLSRNHLALVVVERQVQCIFP